MELKEKPESSMEMEYTFYLISVVRSAGNDPSDKQSSEASEQEMPKMFLKLMTLIEFDTFGTTHGPGTSVEGELQHFSSIFSLKCFHVCF